MPDKAQEHSFTVFPFLKTSQPVSIGGMSLRSTEDAGDLRPDEAERLHEITDMLFLQDDLRIRSASYVTVPFIDLDQPRDSLSLTHLERLQTVIAYCYAAPHKIFGTPFLRYEHASLVILSPSKVSFHVVRTEHHTVPLASTQTFDVDEFGYVQGYKGLYNFKHPLWVRKGSRLYPPVPYLGLNISQDLAADFYHFFPGWPHYQPMLSLIEKPSTTVTLDRVLTAMKWFNSANSLETSEEYAMVNSSCPSSVEFSFSVPHVCRNQALRRCHKSIAARCLFVQFGIVEV